MGSERGFLAKFAIKIRAANLRNDSVTIRQCQRKTDHSYYLKPRSVST